MLEDGRCSVYLAFVDDTRMEKIVYNSDFLYSSAERYLGSVIFLSVRLRPHHSSSSSISSVPLNSKNATAMTHPDAI